MSKKIKVSPTLTVKHIGVFSFNLRQLNFTKENRNVRFSIHNNLKFSVENNIINLTLLVSYNHPDTDPFLVMEIENIFELTELNKFIPVNTDKDVTSSEMNIPEYILITIASVSFSHTRALMGHHIAGTFAQGIYLPIIDGRDFAKNIFGQDKIK